MGRTIGAVLAGVLVVFVIVFGFQWVGALLNPLPEGVDPMDPADREALVTFMETLPLSGWLLAFGSEVLGALLGALAAGWISRDHPRRASAIVVGVAVMASLNNWRMFSHPAWFMVGQLVAYAAVLALAWRLLGESEQAREDQLQEA